MPLSKLDMLNYAVENGILDLEAVQKTIELNERKEYLKRHKGKIWETNGIFYTYVPCEGNERGLKLLKRKSEKSLDDAIVAYYKAVETEPYIPTVYREWVAKKLEYSEIERQTADRYEVDYNKFLKNSDLAKVKFPQITEDMLESFIKKTISENELTAKAWANLRVLINGIFKYAKKKGYTKISITHFMGDLDLSKKSFRKVIVNPSAKVFTDSEEARIMNVLKNEEFTLLVAGVMIGFQTGLRSGELSALKWSDIHDDYISVTKTEIRYKGEDGKYVFEVRDFPKSDAGVRDLVILKETSAIFRQARKLNPFGEYVFMKNGDRIKGKMFTNKLYRTCDKADISKRSMHKARMTYGTQLIDARIPDSVVKEQMGHVDISTTKKYYYFNNRDKRETQDLLKNALYREKVTQVTLQEA